MRFRYITTFKNGSTSKGRWITENWSIKTLENVASNLNKNRSIVSWYIEYEVNK